MTLDTDITQHYEIPLDIEKLARMARADIYGGPTYLDQDGEEVSMFDPSYDHPFDFTGACNTISDWCGDNVSHMYYDADCGQLMDHEPQWEEDEDGNMIEPAPYYEVAPVDIKQALFGRELAHHI